MIEVFAYIYNFEKKICRIIYREYSCEEFEYIFEPYYDEIDSTIGFKGIQGINLSLRKKEYVRKNIIPSFIYEHSHLTFEFRDNKCYVRDRIGNNDFHYANKIGDVTLLEYLATCDIKYFGDNLTIRNK